MFDAIKKTLLAGVGAAVITKDKADEVIADFVKRGKVNAADARKMAHQLARQGRAEFKSVSREVEKQVKDLVEVNDAVARERIEFEFRVTEGAAEGVDDLFGLLDRLGDIVLAQDVGDFEDGADPDLVPACELGLHILDRGGGAAFRISLGADDVDEVFDRRLAVLDGDGFMAALKRADGLPDEFADRAGVFERFRTRHNLCSSPALRQFEARHCRGRIGVCQANPYALITR
ncbi:MAG: hypothetical protein HUU15_10410 [Candidatus Brocadiae bacterium]|nr:hypothetical protein [Candidatus Brocadiia bacterium]